MLQLYNDWKARLALRSFVEMPILTESGIAWGFGSILLRSRYDQVDVVYDDQDERLLCLLSAAGLVQPHFRVQLLLKTALSEWERGQKAEAAIRLAFVPMPKLAKIDDAYRLYLAEQAFDAGLDRATLLKALRSNGDSGIAKYDRNQPRVPAGNARQSGEFSGKPLQAELPSNDRAVPRVNSVDKPIMPIFFDDRKTQTSEEKNPIVVLPFGGRERHGLTSPDLDLEIDVVPPFPLPVPIPIPEPDENDGPSCPPMLPDRPHGDNPSGEREEARVAALVNPDSPTPKKTPEMPDVVSMAYYLLSPLGKMVAIDDCKRSDVPSLIPGIKKGDMVEVKTAGAAALIDLFPDTAGKEFIGQIGRQIDAIDLEGKGRSLYVCVGNSENIASLSKHLAKENSALLKARFTVCR